MREKIILAPSANSTEMLRLLAVHGKNQLGTRIFNPIELAEFALMKSGQTAAEKFLGTSEAVSLIYSFMNDYFPSASFSDAKNIVSSLNSVRNLITENESETFHDTFSKGVFKEKNAAIIKVYDRYMSALEISGYTDGIQLVRLAIEKSKSIAADFIILEEFPLTPLERMLIDTLSDGNFKTVSLCSLLDIPEKTVHFSDIIEAYGASNEAEYLIGTIYENNLPLDSCTVAVTDTKKYSQIIYDIACQYNIPVTFGCGLPITNSMPAVLLKKFHIWETSGYYGADSLHDMIFSVGFDRQKLCERIGIDKKYLLNKPIEIAGNLRLSCDSKANREKISAYRSTLSPNSTETAELELAEKIFAEFSHGCSYIIRNYSFVRKNSSAKIDRSALNAVCDELDTYSRFTENSSDCIITDILEKTICSENSSEGCLHITGINQAISSLRKNLFVMGLSSDNFPGAPAENYLILDEDYLLLGNDTPASENKIEQNKKRLNDLLKTASSLNNEIHLSYSGYDTAELKEENASSVLFELFRNQNGGNVTIKDFEDSVAHIGFFSQKISAGLIGSPYNNGDVIEPPKATSPEITAEISLERAFSMSEIESFFECQKKYYFEKVLGIKSENTDDVFTVISPIKTGNIIHDLMNQFSKNEISHEDFISEAKQRFDEHLLSRPPINEIEAERAFKTFMNIAENAYKSKLENKVNKVIYSEEDITVTHPSGIKLNGRIDRVEKTPDGRMIVVDYKTGSKIIQENDIDSCLQVLLYASMLKHQGFEISGGEYRYLRFNHTIECEYNSAVERELDLMLRQFAEAVRNARFEPNKDCEKCKKCNLENICKKEDKKND